MSIFKQECNALHSKIKTPLKTSQGLHLSKQKTIKIKDSSKCLNRKNLHKNESKTTFSKWFTKTQKKIALKERTLEKKKGSVTRYTPLKKDGTIAHKRGITGFKNPSNFDFFQPKNQKALMS